MLKTMKSGLLMTAALACLAVGQARASTMTAVSTITAPSPGADDIYNLNTSANVVGSDVLSTSHQAAGQTFTTLGNASGYSLTALTFGNTHQTKYADGTFTLRIGTVSGNTFTPIFTENSADLAANDLKLSNTAGAIDWITFTLSSPVTLSANTVYGIDLGIQNVSHYTQWGYTADAYSGGKAYLSGPVSPSTGVGDSSLTYDTNTAGTASYDRLFDAHITANAVPEPASMALALAGFALLGFRRFRKRLA